MSKSDMFINGDVAIICTWVLFTVLVRDVPDILMFLISGSGSSYKLLDNELDILLIYYQY